MVHRRAFSFTDDSASVAPETVNKEEIFRQTLEPAKQLFRLRQLESSTYQTLYLANRHEMPWPDIASGLSQTRIWLENLSDSFSTPFRDLFRAEVLFVNVLFLSAPSTSQSPCEYGNASLFDNAIKYAETMSHLIHGPDQLAPYTSHVGSLRRHLLPLTVRLTPKL